MEILPRRGLGIIGIKPSNRRYKESCKVSINDDVEGDDRDQGLSSNPDNARAIGIDIADAPKESIVSA